MQKRRSFIASEPGDVLNKRVRLRSLQYIAAINVMLLPEFVELLLNWVDGGVAVDAA